MLFLVFNRPDLTNQVFKRIREVEPNKLYIGSDGPREDILCDFAKIAEVRRICSKVDWKCNVSHLYRETNLGCRDAVGSAISWFFEHESEGIILEDDCLPDLSFFHYCEELLSTYRDMNNIFLISGSNFLPSYPLKTSYVFSRLVLIWGWATWRRAWKHYDTSMSEWLAYSKTNDLDYFASQKSIVYKLLDDEYHNENERTWGTQWRYHCLLNSGLSIIPRSNLIKNIGFGRNDATRQIHTHIIANLPVVSMEFPLVHPREISPNRELDERSLEFYYKNKYKVSSS